MKRFGAWIQNQIDRDVIEELGLSHSTTETETLEHKVETMFQVLRAPVYQYLLSVFGDVEEAEDLTQESFVRLYKAFRDGSEIKNVRFWVFKVARNLAIDKKRHEEFIRSMQTEGWDDLEQFIRSGEPDPEQATLLNQRFKLLHMGLNRLTLNERQAIYLRAEGFRYKQIAEIMQVTVPTVSEYLRRSIRKLRESINE